MKIYNIITGDDLSTVKAVKQFLDAIDCDHKLKPSPYSHHACQTDEQGTMTSYEHKVLMNLATDKKGAYDYENRTTCYLFILWNYESCLMHNVERFSYISKLIADIKKREQ